MLTHTHQQMHGWLSGQTRSSVDCRRFCLRSQYAAHLHRHSGAIDAYSHFIWRSQALAIANKRKKSNKQWRNSNKSTHLRTRNARRFSARRLRRLIIVIVPHLCMCIQSLLHVHHSERHVVTHEDIQIIVKEHLHIYIYVYVFMQRGNVCYCLLSLANPTSENSSNFSYIFQAQKFKQVRHVSTRTSTKRTSTYVYMYVFMYLDHRLPLKMKAF